MTIGDNGEVEFKRGGNGAQSDMLENAFSVTIPLDDDFQPEIGECNSRKESKNFVAHEVVLR